MDPVFISNQSMDLKIRNLHQATLLSDICQEYEAGAVVEVKISNGESEKSVCCHRLMLVAASRFLRHLLADVPEEEEVCLVLPEVPHTDLVDMVNKLYGVCLAPEKWEEPDLFQTLVIGSDFETSEDNFKKNVAPQMETVVTFDLPSAAELSENVQNISAGDIESIETEMEVSENKNVVLDISGGRHVNGLTSTFTIGTPVNVIKLSHGDETSTSLIETPAEPSREEAFQCDICNKRFPSSKKLKFHRQKVHQVDCAFKCDHCDLTLASATSLEIHTRSHTGVRPFSCTLCDKTFTSLHYLIQHQDFHRATKDFECDVCNKKYQNANALNQHKTDFHSNVKYQCDICFKLFSAKRYLREHERKKHANIGNNYKCEICQKILAGKNELKIHSRIHTGEKPFHCGECDKYFRARSTFAIHMKSHSGTKNAVCEECGKRFIQWGDLRKHKRTHTGERPFKCGMCGRSFARKDYLTKHERTHRGDVDRVTVTSISREEDNLVLDVNGLNNLVGGETENQMMQVVTIIDGRSRELVDIDGHEKNLNIDSEELKNGLKSGDNVFYVIST